VRKELEAARSDAARAIPLCKATRNYPDHLAYYRKAQMFEWAIDQLITGKIKQPPDM
jgi:hypothetical protein